MKNKKPKVNTPRPYLSYSQFNLFERNPEMYKEIYIEGREQYPNDRLELGKEVAEALETGKSKNPIIKHLLTFLPSYPKVEYDIRAKLGDIPLLGRLDGFDDVCPSCGYRQDMVELNYEEQQGAIQKRTQSSKRMEGKGKQSKFGSSSVVQGNERNNETKSNKFQKGTDTVEQGQKVFSSKQIENEYIKVGNKTATLNTGTQSKNKQSKLEGENFPTGTRKKNNSVQKLEKQSVRKRRLDLSMVQKERIKIRSGSYKGVGNIPKIKIYNRKWKNIMQQMPQKTTFCETCYNKPYLICGEFKTGKKWTQSMADKSDQLTFYALLVGLKYKTMPKEIYLHWMATDDSNGLKLTGEIKTFKTQRSKVDILKLSSRIKKVWEGIQFLCQEK